MSKRTIITCDDLCTPNEISTFDCSDNTEPRIGGLYVGFQPEDWRYEGCDQELAEYTRSTLLPILNRRIWLFFIAGWRNPTRIQAYKKLWRSLRLDLRYDLTDISFSDEVEFVYDEMVCYAGVIEVPPERFPTAIDIYRHTGDFMILSNRPDMSSAENIIATYSIADIRYYTKWQELCMTLCPLTDILVRLPPVWDTPPRAFESTLYFYMLQEELARVKEHLCL